jgi:hypothetical protein
MCLQVSYKKNMKKFFFASLKSLKKEVGSKVDMDPDPLVRCTDPRIRICTKMSRIPNTGRYKPTRKNYKLFSQYPRWSKKRSRRL